MTALCIFLLCLIVFLLCPFLQRLLGAIVWILILAYWLGSN
jgi:hypothetical protein